MRVHRARRGRLLLREDFSFPSFDKFPEGRNPAGSVVETIDSRENHFHPTLSQALRRHLTASAEDNFPTDAFSSPAGNHVFAISPLPFVAIEIHVTALKPLACHRVPFTR